MDAAVALQRKKTIKFLCIVDFSLSKQGVFFVTLRHKTVMKKMSQSFFLCCIVENWRFRQPIFGHGFTVLSKHFSAVLPT